MNTFKVRLLSILILVCMLSVLPGSYAQAKGTILRVKWDAPGPTHNGSSWTYAYTDLQSALAASQPGTQIWVARGTYKPTTGSDRSISFELRDGVGIYGGFVGNETMRDQRDPVANVTILSGDIGVAGVVTDNSYHVLTDNIKYGLYVEYAALDGFTVTSGNANEDRRGGGLSFTSPVDNAKLELRNMIFSGSIAAWEGGGVYYNAYQLLLDNVTFEDNKAASSGGGMHFHGDSLDLRNVKFSGNVSHENGGGLYAEADNVMLNSVTFENNEAAYGGGGMKFGGTDADLDLKNVIFRNNTAYIAGGGLWLSGNATLENTTFVGNRVTADTGEGGGLLVSPANVTLDHVLFKGNRATHHGGGVFNLGTMTITNSTFYANRITSNYNYGGLGAGIYNSQYYENNSPVNATLTVVNSTFYKNSTVGIGGGIYNRGMATISYSTFSENSALQDGAGVRNSSGASMELNNSILANSASSADCTNYGNFSGNHNLIETHDGSGCGSPLLASDPNLGSLRDNGGETTTMALLPGSPAIDTADDEVCPERDQRGVGRPEGAHCDLGAYEAPLVGPGTYDDTDANWVYSEFIATTTTGPYLGTFHYSTAVGGYAEFLFTGSQITLLYSKYNNRGDLEVYVDGDLVDTIDQYNATRVWQASWTSGDLGAGGHTVRLVHAGPDGSTVDVDAITILP